MYQFGLASGLDDFVPAVFGDVKCVCVVGGHFTFPFFNLDFLIERHLIIADLIPFLCIVRAVMHDAVEYSANQQPEIEVVCNRRERNGQCE